MKRDREKDGDSDVGPGNLLGGAGRSAYDDLDAAAARSVYDDRPQLRWLSVTGIAFMQTSSNSFSKYSMLPKKRILTLYNRKLSKNYRWI